MEFPIVHQEVMTKHEVEVLGRKSNEITIILIIFCLVDNTKEEVNVALNGAKRLHFNQICKLLNHVSNSLTFLTFWR